MITNSLAKFVLQIISSDPSSQSDKMKRNIRNYQKDIFDRLTQSPVFQQISNFSYEEEVYGQAREESKPLMIQGNPEPVIEGNNFLKQDHNQIHEGIVKEISPIGVKKRIRKILQKPINVAQVVIRNGCKCTKSQCQKQYCECFAAGVSCSDQCQCSHCGNQEKPKECLKQSRKYLHYCTCTKSKCVKKYCECYLNGRDCSDLCKCSGCENCLGFRTTRTSVRGQLTNNMKANSSLINRLNIMHQENKENMTSA